MSCPKSQTWPSWLGPSSDRLLLRARRDTCFVTPEQVVGAIYSAWLERRSAREWIAEDVEYVNPHDAVETGVKHGRQYFRGIRDVYDEVVILSLIHI